ncbi:MAG: PLP-dependent aminotransferase family protein [Geodermatophilaceae bacterium]
MWLAATRDVLRLLPDEELGYVAPWGALALREELADYLKRVRAAMVEPDHLVIVTGATQGLTLLVRMLAETGHTILAVESPSNASQRRVLGRHISHILDVPVDDEGLVVTELERTACRAVLVTPSHQYPSGVMLSPARRSELIRWAQRVDGVILEDDYAPEFRFERGPIGCLQGLDPQHVALVGSVSKSLAPGLRLGWVVAPLVLHEMLLAAKRDDDFGSPVLSQHVLARLLANGAYDRHIRRTRRRYMERRDALVTALAEELPDWEMSGRGRRAARHAPASGRRGRGTGMCSRSGQRPRRPGHPCNVRLTARTTQPDRQLCARASRSADRSSASPRSRQYLGTDRDQPARTIPRSDASAPPPHSTTSEPCPGSSRKRAASSHPLARRAWIRSPESRWRRRRDEPGRRHSPHSEGSQWS